MPDDATITLGVVGCAAAKAKTARQALLLVSQTVGENAAAVRAKGEELAEARLSARLLAELHIQTKSADTLLLFAVAHDLVDVARHALRAGANKDVTDDKLDVDDEGDYDDYNHHVDGNEVCVKNTALIIAVRRSSIRCLQLLLEAGADQFKANKAGDIPLSAAAQTGNADCLPALLDHARVRDNEVDWGKVPITTVRTLLLHAAESGSAECVRLLVKAGLCLFCPGWYDNGLFPLLGAVKRGHLDCVQVLLTAIKEAESSLPSDGARVWFCLPSDGADGVKDAVQTAALYASSRGKTECLRLLIKAGADPEQLP